MMKNKIAILLLFPFFINACKTEGDEQSSPSLRLGQWTIKMHINDSLHIPFTLNIEDNEMLINNADEIITVNNLKNNEDSLVFDVATFSNVFRFKKTSDSTLIGSYTIPDKENYVMNVSGYYNTPRFEGSHEKQIEGKYEVTFQYDTNDTEKTIGLFKNTENEITGSIVTRTGDYRYLEGITTEDKLYLSCFDGAHAFLFTADITSNEILENGKFYSGHLWSTNWVAEKNDSFQLEHPDSLTVSTTQKIEFSFPDLDSNIQKYTEEDFKGKVTMVQIMGTWCPNCMDESRYYQSLYEAYNKKGLDIVAVAFERRQPFEKQSLRVKKWRNAEGITYNTLIGGDASKTIAAEKFPSLNHVLSFPTTIFIDKKGQIRKIHTGFYGPATGELYSNYTIETEAFIKKLLAE